MGDLLRYLTLKFNITRPSGLYNNAFWSLPVEFQYYLLFPLLLVSLRFMSVFGPMLIAGTLFLLARADVLPMASDLVLILAFTFAAGMILGHVYQRWSVRLNRVFSLGLIASMTALATLMSNDILPIEVFWVVPSEWVFYGFCGVGIVALILFSELRLPDFLRPTALYLGKISYSLYLYHNLLIALAVLGLIQLGIHSDWIRTLWVCFWAFGGSLVLASLSYRWIEQPGVGLGRYLNSTTSQPGPYSQP